MLKKFSYCYLQVLVIKLVGDEKHKFKNQWLYPKMLASHSHQSSVNRALLCAVRVQAGKAFSIFTIQFQRSHLVSAQEKGGKEQKPAP